MYLKDAIIQKARTGHCMYPKWPEQGAAFYIEVAGQALPPAWRRRGAVSYMENAGRCNVRSRARRAGR